MKKSGFLNLNMFTGMTVVVLRMLDLAFGTSAQGLLHAGFRRRRELDLHESQDRGHWYPARRADPDVCRDLLDQESRVPLVLDDVRRVVLRQLRARRALSSAC